MDRLYNIQSVFAECVFCIPGYRRGFACDERQLDPAAKEIQIIIIVPPLGLL
jgi:hypothetical protein